MKRLLIFALLTVLVTGASAALALSDKKPAANTSDLPSEKVQVYDPAPEISAPVLVPADYAKELASNCSHASTAEAILGFVVDAGGVPRDTRFLQATGDDVDLLLLRIVNDERFKPAMKDGSAIAVGLAEKIKVEVCAGTSTDANGKRIERHILLSPPQQVLGRWQGAPTEITVYAAEHIHGNADPMQNGSKVTAPVPVHSSAARFSDEARRKNIQGACLITFIVDTQGVPRDVQVVRKMGYGLDEEAIKSISDYRFKPATRDGKPVPVYLTSKVAFHLY